MTLALPIPRPPALPERERQRLVRELREDLGGRLLSQLLQARPLPAETRAALDAVMELIDTLDARRFRLEECLEEWDSLLRQRCEGLGLALETFTTRGPGPWLSSLQRVTPLRILGAWLDLVSPLGRCDRLTLRVDTRPGPALRLQAELQGALPAPARWPPSLALRHMQWRAADLDGSLCLDATPEIPVRLVLRFPLQTDQETP
ncbi:MAG TPA: hypothetical protein VFV27_10225 [Nevskiaceae bacterium]|nr:hypothetical protein [Nevskiaceae bacterium]